jgi:ABC-2 type transport system ATP-binding protein
MMNSAIEVTDLIVHRGRNDVLRSITARVPTGQVVGLLGPSGSGKTTLMRAVVGVQRITRGTLTVLGRPAGHPRLRSLIGYVSQTPSVYDDLTVRQNLTYFGRIVGAPAGDVDRVLDEVDLRGEQRSLVRDLSGGQQSRVSLAAALLGSPELLVLDEPTVGLDPVLRRDLWDLFRALAARGTTLLVSSHVIDEAQRCDRILLLREGALLADVTPAELLERTGTSDADEAFLALVGSAR